MTGRRVGIGLLVVPLLMIGRAPAQEAPDIPSELQKTYGAFAAAMVEGDADAAIAFYAENAVVLVDHEHLYRGWQAIRDGFLAEYLEIASQADDEGAGTEIGVDGAVVGEGVVTLAGRYTNPSGAAGIYSNTWERQADGSWKLAASALTFEASDPMPGPSAGGFSCTQVLGFSQSMEWYAGLSVRDLRRRGTRPDLSALAPDAYLPGWQGRFFMGAAVEEWRDPEYPGWSGAHRRAHETPAHCGRDEIDRVVFNVSGTARSPDAWAGAVDSVADLIRSKFPAVRRVVMQPVVGAPEGKCTDVQAARTHLAVVEGIRRAADRGGITAGPSPKVASCDQFSDDLGHLTEEGAGHVRRILREHYRSSTAGPDQSDRPGEMIVHTTLRPPNQDIYLVERPGAEPRPVTDHPALDYNATFSPDGEWIAFVSDRGGMADEFLLTDDPQPYGEIWAVPVEGGDAVRLTNDKWEDGLPRRGISGRR